MRLRVELLPQGPYLDVVVLIDVLRTSTVAPLLFDKGITQLYLCSSVRASKAMAEKHGHLLLGERGGLPPEGFNYGNSPAQLLTITLPQRGAVLTSENAPKAVPLVSGAKHVLLGSLFNAEAVVARAQALATSEIVMVCCGFGGREDLDDTLTAGFLTARLKQALPEAELHGAASLALSLLSAFPDPLEGLWQSRTGHYLRRLGLLDDIAVTSMTGASDKVPELTSVLQDEGKDFYCFEHASEHPNAAP